MTPHLSRRLTLDLVVTGPDSITGRLSDPSGKSTDFVGWLGLAGAIEALSTEQRRAVRT
jgi:hypothetical protein